MGASGYTGSELLKILLRHPYIKVKEIIGDKSAGMNISKIFSNFAGFELPIVKYFDEVDFTNIDVIFSCAPSGVLANIINKLPESLTVIDLSSDFRIKDVELYNNYYDTHKNPAFLKKFTYGLTEIFKEQILNSKFISCPGCYPTSVLLPLIPLLESNLINNSDIIIDSKSGITGAGRNTKVELLFSENYGSIKPYGNGNHRHKPEIEHIIKLITNKKIHISFTPHIIPINRGILSTIYIKSDLSLVKEKLNTFYQNSNFVKTSKDSTVPKISDVVGSNLCRIGFIKNYDSDWITIISVIDNLVKGASGQAVQNFNLIMNYPEDLGLDKHSL